MTGKEKGDLLIQVTAE